MSMLSPYFYNIFNIKDKMLNWNSGKVYWSSGHEALTKNEDGLCFHAINMGKPVIPCASMMRRQSCALIKKHIAWQRIEVASSVLGEVPTPLQSAWHFADIQDALSSSMLLMWVKNFLGCLGAIRRYVSSVKLYNAFIFSLVFSMCFLVF
uniref:Uncharacterized protein n=1 Tax=Pyxicephalus adspersus TaxID=30357 RepID=A0AAV3B4J0_PYXAD|nr:TPA: hypothetical protein GDO54_002121 [Pyxicephalus adspersus]